MVGIDGMAHILVLVVIPKYATTALASKRIRRKLNSQQLPWLLNARFTYKFTATVVIVEKHHFDHRLTLKIYSPIRSLQASPFHFYTQQPLPPAYRHHTFSLLSTPRYLLPSPLALNSIGRLFHNPVPFRTSFRFKLSAHAYVRSLRCYHRRLKAELVARVLVWILCMSEGCFTERGGGVGIGGVRVWLGGVRLSM